MFASMELASLCQKRIDMPRACLYSMLRVSVPASQLNRLLLPPWGAALGTSNRHRSTSMSLLLCLRSPRPPKAQAHLRKPCSGGTSCAASGEHKLLHSPENGSVAAAAQLPHGVAPHAGTPLSSPVPMARLSEEAARVFFFCWDGRAQGRLAAQVCAGGAGAPVERVGGRQVEAQLRQHLRKTPQALAGRT